MSERTPIIWKVTHPTSKTRLFLVYDNAAIATNDGQAFFHPIAIEFNRTGHNDNAPPHEITCINATFGTIAIGAIEVREGQIEPLPISQYGLSHTAALCALDEAEHFVTMPSFQYPSGKAIYDIKATKKKIPAAAKVKSASHVWKLMAWMNWSKWNKEEFSYAKRAEILTKMGFEVTASAIKSAAQVRGIPTITSRT